jgi:hypothetical protein
MNGKALRAPVEVGTISRFINNIRSRRRVPKLIRQMCHPCSRWVHTLGASDAGQTSIVSLCQPNPYLMFDPNQSKNLYGFKRVEGQRVLSQFLIENLR